MEQHQIFNSISLQFLNIDKCYPGKINLFIWINCKSKRDTNKIPIKPVISNRNIHFTMISSNAQKLHSRSNLFTVWLVWYMKTNHVTFWKTVTWQSISRHLTQICRKQEETKILKKNVHNTNSLYNLYSARYNLYQIKL